MKGIFQLADLTVQVEGSIEELVDCQGVEREFDRACRKIRKAAGDADVQILLDKNLQSGEGREFSKIRLRAYSDGKNFTIDCGSTEDNILGVYVDWDAPVEVYDRESETVEEVQPLESGSSTPSQEGSKATQNEAGEERTYAPDNAPAPQTDAGNRVTENAAKLLWKAAQVGGHNRSSFQKMLASVAGVERPQLLHIRDWEDAWKYSCDPAQWKEDYDLDGQAKELPLE